MNLLPDHVDSSTLTILLLILCAEIIVIYVLWRICLKIDQYYHNQYVQRLDHIWNILEENRNNHDRVMRGVAASAFFCKKKDEK